jgi:hypothetical protein
MTIEYNEIEVSIPKPPSLNQLYAGKFWTYRHGQKESTLLVFPERLKDLIGGLWTASLSTYAIILGMILTTALLLLSFLQIIYGIMDTFTMILLNTSWSLESRMMQISKKINTSLK